MFMGFVGLIGFLWFYKVWGLGFRALFQVLAIYLLSSFILTFSLVFFFGPKP